MKIRYFMTSLAGVLACSISSGSALATEYRLHPGEWQLTEGLAIDNNSAASNLRTFCIDARANKVSDTWLANFSKLNDSCTTRVVSSTPSEVNLESSCPNSDGDISGPIHIEVNSGYFTIDSQLAMDYSGIKIPLRRQLTARRIGDCAN
ncbi:MAG: hypothetical protein CMK09_07130 [Ponticaulis sp.]|nr:hypothetical protein [Ponticaulis sp.]